MAEKRSILLIEDERTISNFICRALNANDYKAIPAISGKEGISLFFSHQPDLVLLDLGLPDMDGLEVLEQLSGLPQDTPVIIISARDREVEKLKHWIWVLTTMLSNPLVFLNCWPASVPHCAALTVSN